MPKKELYHPEIIRKEVNDEHYYFVNGTFMPSVTKILGEAMPTPFALKNWLGEVGNERAELKLRKAGERGTLIHKACERLLKGEEISLIDEFPSREDKKVLVGFVNWISEVQPEVIATEKTVASRYGYAGTLDLYCIINSRPWIIDWKTSAGVYESHKLQLRAYHQAVLEMTGENAELGILHLNSRTKKGWTFYGTEEMTIKKKPVEISDFMVFFEAYKVLNGGIIPPPPEIDSYPETLKIKKI